MKRTTCLLLTIVMVLSLLAGFAPYAHAADNKTIVLKAAEEPAVTVTGGKYDLPDISDAFAGYVDKAFGVADSIRNVSGGAANLTDPKDILAYDRLAVMIAQVAAGDRSSTAFEITPADLGITKDKFTAEDLGVSSLIVNGSINSTALANLRALYNYNYNLVLKQLMFALPYDLYWFDKTAGWSYSGVGIGYKSDSQYPNGYLYFTDTRVLSLSVAGEYRLNGQRFAFDTAIGKSVQTSASNARAIVNSKAGLSDYEKVLAYKDAICDLVSYNDDAAGNSSTPYGNPWQLIWVFDGDESTNVVCEGYSKAFQYLCQLSNFRSSNVGCVSVTGYLSAGTGAGRHMWNVLSMDDGINYLVDVTNCDTWTIGSPDLLFLKGASGSVSGGYTIVCYGTNVSFTYDSDLTDLFSTETLTVSSTDYEPNGTITVASGYCGGEGDGTNLTWTLDSEGTLTISGTGAMADYTSTGAPWAHCSCDVVTATVGSGVTTIGNYAFYGCTEMTDITIGNSVTSLGRYSLSGCAFTSITIPNSVTCIEDSAFKSAAVTSITIPNSVTRIGGYAFSGSALTSITIPSGVTSIGLNAFENCTGLTTAVISNGVTSIGRAMFYGCTSLSNVSIGNTVTTIGNDAFYHCTGLTGIEIPDSVTTIGYNAFYWCTGLTDITIPDSVTSIGNHAFYLCTGLTSAVIGEGVEALTNDLFRNCSNLAYVVLPSGLTTISSGAFMSCGSLSDVCFFGSEEDWAAIAIGDGNNVLDAADKHIGYDWKHTGFEWLSTDPVSAYALFECTECGRTGMKAASVTQSGVVLTAAVTGPDGVVYTEDKVLAYATLKAANLSLEGKISINFKLTTDYSGLVAKLYYEKNGFAQVAEVPLDDAHFVTDPNGGDHYLVSYTEVPAKEMTQSLRIKVFDSTGMQVKMKISSGYIDQYDYSVAKWCNNKISQNNNANDVMIAKALLNYGHYTQLALKYNDGIDGRPNKLANPNGYLADEMANFAGGNSEYDSVTAGGTALGAKAFALVLESNTSIKLKLKREVTVQIDGVDATLTEETDGDGSQIWCAFKTNVAAKRLHEKSSFYLFEPGHYATLQYGALSWANKKLAGTDVNDKNLAKAMYLYNYAARKYFNYDAAGLQ